MAEFVVDAGTGTLLEETVAVPVPGTAAVEQWRVIHGTRTAVRLGPSGRPLGGRDNTARVVRRVHPYPAEVLVHDHTGRTLFDLTRHWENCVSRLQGPAILLWRADLAP